ncbi:MAG: sugar phosphate isomerase/epimerase family protein [Anaerolineae bacterium]|nr:sugar phosphate isomerase/epimerase [Thermoflexus sp.]MDW8064275.1 sugar phosphate isomerase/epimerase family protein [Anaerolineae bacterium]
MIGISCSSLEDLFALRDFAEAHGLGLELQEFAQPEILDGEWRSLLRRYRRILVGFSGPISLHGPFVDLFSGSVDPRIAAVAMERYRQSLEIAAELGAWLVNFHLNYNPLVDEPTYRPRWLERQMAFWAELALEAQEAGLRIALENMWEPDPFLQVEVIQRVNHFCIGACLDIGHAYLYSRVPLQAWISVLEPVLIYAHIHNTTGVQDRHLPLTQGVIPIEPVLDRLVRCLNRPMLILEMPDLAGIRESFPILQHILQRASWP